MKKRTQSRFTAGAFAITLLSQAVHAEIDPVILANTFDAVKAIRAIANQVRTTSSKINSSTLNPTAEQRVIIVNAITHGSSHDDHLMHQMILSAQSPIQSVLEAASCLETNRMTSVDSSPFGHYFSFTGTKSSSKKMIMNRCADVVRVDQWDMPKPGLLEFTAMFRPVQTMLVNTWRFKIKQQPSGIWELESRKNISFKNGS